MTDRLYYQDSFLSRFTAHVTDIREDSRADGVSLWQIALDRTAFYPTSGGQPFDTGLFRATSRSGAVLEATVESVEEDASGQVWHYTRKPLLAGTAIEAEIDWERRLDHIQQHSGQHLLSAVFAHEIKAPTVGFHLGETESTIDLAVPPPAHHTIERIERLANQLIAEDRAVSIRTAPRAEAESLLAQGKLSKLPEREGDIRLIEIADYDLNACGGTHVRSTGQIGALLLRGVEKNSRGCRITFVAGDRAIAAARSDHELLHRAAGILSTGTAGIPAAVEKLLAESKIGARERMRLREEVATYHASRLLVEELPQHNLRVICRIFPDRDRDYIRLLASRVVASVPHTLALLASSESSPASIVLARTADLDLHCGETLTRALAVFGSRGGGSPDLAQGQLDELEVPNFFAQLTHQLREFLRSETANT
ncbi:alanyl-tRNA editing protein [Silvibacterium dinghuense]|nr:alanine--tRNA ligase-related protein [Silvibacterium dinghuense]GGH15219.1 alanyl-tRNA editing protein [Silvibacterium dinghuense]